MQCVSDAFQLGHQKAEDGSDDQSGDSNGNSGKKNRYLSTLKGRYLSGYGDVGLKTEFRRIQKKQALIKKAQAMGKHIYHFKVEELLYVSPEPGQCSIRGN